MPKAWRGTGYAEVLLPRELTVDESKVPLKKEICQWDVPRLPEVTLSRMLYLPFAVRE